MPQHVFHDICLDIVWHTKNDERLEAAARDDVSSGEDEEPPAIRENG